MEEHGHTVEEIRSRLTTERKKGHLRDFIYGGIDGAVTTFAIVAGVKGSELPHSVIVALGIANVLADGFSMAAGNYTGTKADLENYERLRAVERQHILRNPEGERSEVREIMRLKGFSGDNLEAAVEAITADEQVWLNTMLVEEYGVAPIDPSPMPAALATFVAFLTCGFVPLMPFLLGVNSPFVAAIISTAFVFFLIGAVKSRWTLKSWWRSGLETLAIGTAAAAIAYFVGHLVSEWTG